MNAQYNSKFKILTRNIVLKLLQVSDTNSVQNELESIINDLENDFDIQLTAWGIFKFDKGFLLTFCESIASFSIMFQQIIPE